MNSINLYSALPLWDRMLKALYNSILQPKYFCASLTLQYIKKQDFYVFCFHNCFHIFCLQICIGTIKNNGKAANNFSNNQTEGFLDNHIRNLSFKAVLASNNWADHLTDKRQLFPVIF